MSDAKALPAAKAKSEKPAKPQSDLSRSVGLINRFIAGQRGVFGMAMLMLVLEALTSIWAKFPLTWLLDYLKGQGATPPNGAQELGKSISKAFDWFPAVAASISNFFTPLSQNQVLLFLSVMVLLLALANSASDSFSELYLVKGGRLLGFSLRDKLYAHLQKLSLAFFGRQRTGDLLTRVTGDVTALEEFAVKSLKDIAGSVFLITLTLGTLFIIDWRMGVIALVTVPILSLASNYFADRIKTASKKQRAQEGALASGAQEMLTSIRVIQVYGSSGDQQKKFAETSKKAMDIAVQVGQLTAAFGAVISLLQQVVVVVIIWLAVWLVSQGQTSIGTVVLFVGLIQDLFKPTKRIIKQWNEVGKIVASAERISEVLDRRPAVQDPPNAKQAPRFQGYIEFSHVSFAYMPEPEDMKDGKMPMPRLALRDVNFTVEPGEVVALVGGSGAGKSTIVQLLPRLYDPHAGAITFDGQDIRSFSLDSLRSQMSMVLQEAILFTGTVAENIAYGRPNATREEIIAAAMQASAHDFIQKMPDGYDTVLSERASNLSGGQRQRIAIARAFIRNTQILILDEPTTGLDAESTELVQLALKSLMRGKATVIISHDLNLIRQADKIIAIKDGQIEQVGSHRELLRRGGLYADLYNKQFGNVVAEQGGQMKPADQPKPATLPPLISPRKATPLPASVADLIDDDDDEEEVEQVTGKAFQTLIGKAVPAPVSEKAFQTLMMQAVQLPPSLQVPPPPASKPASPAPAPAASAQPPVQPAQVLRPIQAPQAGPPAQSFTAIPAPEPAKPAAPAPAPAQPPAQPAQSFAPVPAPEPAKPATPAPAKPATPAPAKSEPAGQLAQPAQSVTPAPAKSEPAGQPAMFETTVLRTVPPEPQAATGRTEIYPATPPADDGRATVRISSDELGMLRSGTKPQSAAGPHQSGASGLRGERLDLLQSRPFQEEFPGALTAFDASAIREYIQSTLFGKARPNVTIEKCELDQATYLPGEAVSLRYNVVAKDRITLQTFEPLVIGMIFPSQIACALYMRDKLAPLIELMRGRPELTPFATPAAIIEPLDMILHIFPIDGELPALVPATDPQQIGEVLRETLPESIDGTFEIERCRVQLIDYARRYRSVLRYQVEGRRPGASRNEHRLVYGKVFDDTLGALTGPVTAALREGLVGGRGYQFNVPRVLGWRADMRLALLEAIPGEPVISDMLKARLRGRPTP